MVMNTRKFDTGSFIPEEAPENKEPSDIHDSMYLPSLEELDDFIASVKDDSDKLEFNGRLEHQLLSKEYIRSLGAYYVDRISQLLEGQEELKIMELGAGSGRLTHFLSNEILSNLSESQKNRVHFVATDKSPVADSLFPVEKMTVKDVMVREEPDMVLLSWPSYNWMRYFDESGDGIKDIMLIGIPMSCEGPYSGSTSEWGDIEGYERIEIDSAIMTGRSHQLKFPDPSTGVTRQERLDSNPAALGVTTAYQKIEE